QVSVTVVGRRTLISGALVFGALLFWALHHVQTASLIATGVATPFAAVFLLTFLLLTVEMIMCYLERPFRTDPDEQMLLDQAWLVSNVPVYNEDPEALRQCLESL